MVTMPALQLASIRNAEGILAPSRGVVVLALISIWLALQGIQSINK